MVWLYIAVYNFYSVRLIIQNPLQIRRENGWLLHEETHWLCEANTFRGEIRRVTSSAHHSLAHPMRDEAGAEVLLFPTLLESQSASETVCCQYLLSPCPQHRGYQFRTALASRVSHRCGCCYCYLLRGSLGLWGEDSVLFIPLPPQGIQVMEASWSCLSRTWLV